MATYSTDLYDLIHSMSGPEKAYYKRYGYKGGKKSANDQYLKLFDAVDKQKAYDEPALRKKFSGKSFSAAKNHLYHSVLQSLMDYNAGKSAWSRAGE